MNPGYPRQSAFAQDELAHLRVAMQSITSDAARAVYERAIAHLEHFLTTERDWEPKRVVKNKRENYGLKPRRRTA